MPALIVALAAATVSASIAASPPAAAAVMPLTAQLRACDQTKLAFASAVGYAQATADVGATSGTIFATVHIASTVPNTHYDVRVVEVPRPSIGCAPGDPGVIVGGLQTDANGVGTTTLQGPVRSGATGAWVIVDRPAEESQIPAEFYTSDFAAAV